METTVKPIVATSVLSFLLHAVAFAGLLLVYDQLTAPHGGVGRGVEIQLISSIHVSDQQQVDVPRRSEIKSETKTVSSSKARMHAAEKKFAENILTSPVSRQTIPVIGSVTEPVATDVVGQNKTEQLYNLQQNQLSADSSKSTADIAQSTSASQQQHTILELLHRRISDNKEYPYLARRQRREGVATVAFVLHPDGKIDHTRLVRSSRATALDRAALSAVKQIEPFMLAPDYLEHAEEFQVNIEFELL